MLFVISTKNVYAAKRLNFESGIMHSALKILDLNWLIDRNFKIFASPKDVLYVRDPYLNGSPKYLLSVISLAKRFQAQGGRVVDGAIVRGDLGKGKWVDYKKLKKAKLPIPKTLMGNSLTAGNYPLIFKWIYGMKGKGTFLINAKSNFKKIPAYILKKELMIQEFVKAEYEYKVITVGYKALPVALKFNIQKSKFGIDFKNYQTVQSSAIPKVIKLAEQASKALGRELAKVDILKDHKGKLYILEVNRFPGLKSFEKLTKYNVAKGFLQYLTGVRK